MKKTCILILIACILFGFLISCSLEQNTSEKSGKMAARNAMWDNVEGEFYRIDKYDEDEFGFDIFRWIGAEWKRIGPEGALRVDVDASGDAWIFNKRNEVFQIQSGNWIYRGRPGSGSHTIVDIGAGIEPCMPPEWPNKGVFVLTRDSSGRGHMYKWNPGIDEHPTRWTLVKETENALRPKKSGDYALRLDVLVQESKVSGRPGEDTGLPIFSNYRGEVYALRNTNVGTPQEKIKLFRYSELDKIFDIACMKGGIYSLKDGETRDNVYVQKWDRKVAEPLYDNGGYYNYPARNLTVDKDGTIWVSETDEGSGNYLYWYAKDFECWIEIDYEHLARDISIGGHF